MEETVGPVSTCGRELLWGWRRPIGLMVSFMIFTASVRKILDQPSYKLTWCVYMQLSAHQDFDVISKPELSIRFLVFMAVSIVVLIFWRAALCTVANRHCSGRTCYLHLQDLNITSPSPVVWITTFSITRSHFIPCSLMLNMERLFLWNVAFHLQCSIMSHSDDWNMNLVMALWDVMLYSFQWKTEFLSFLID